MRASSMTSWPNIRTPTRPCASPEPSWSAARNLPGATGRSERPRIGAAVQQPILAGDIAGLDTTQEGAGGAEFVGAAEAPSRVLLHALRRDGVGALAGALGGMGDGRAQAVGVERSGQQIVDRDVMDDGLAGDAGDETVQARTRAVGEAENVDRRFHRARGDVDDAAE